MPYCVVNTVVWKKNTRLTRSSCNPSLQNTIKELGRALNDGFALLDKLPKISADSAAPLYLFVAPEYLFKAFLPDKSFLYGESDVKTVHAALRELSTPTSSRPNVLVVPGTILWAREIKHSASFDEQREAHLKKRLLKSPNDIQLHKDYAEETADGFKRHVKSTTPLVYGHNESLIYFNGEPRKVVRKTIDTDFTDDDFIPNGVQMPGLGAGTFTLKSLKLKVGVEICGDHFAGRMMAHQKTVNLMIVVSGTIRTIPLNVPMTQGGLFVHADSDEHQSEIAQPALGDWPVFHDNKDKEQFDQMCKDWRGYKPQQVASYENSIANDQIRSVLPVLKDVWHRSSTDEFLCGRAMVPATGKGG